MIRSVTEAISKRCGFICPVVPAHDLGSFALTLDTQLHPVAGLRIHRSGFHAHACARRRFGRYRVAQFDFLIGVGGTAWHANRVIGAGNSGIGLEEQDRMVRNRHVGLGRAIRAVQPDARSMIIPGQGFVRDVLKVGRAVQNHAVRERADPFAKYFLPGRLAGRGERSDG